VDPATPCESESRRGREHRRGWATADAASSAGVTLLITLCNVEP
jgi:hypothetical protein